MGPGQWQGWGNYSINKHGPFWYIQVVPTEDKPVQVKFMLSLQSSNSKPLLKPSQPPPMRSATSYPCAYTHRMLVLSLTWVHMSHVTSHMSLRGFRLGVGMSVRDSSQQGPGSGNDAECPSEEGWDSQMSVPSTSPMPLR